MLKNWLSPNVHMQSDGPRSFAPRCRSMFHNSLLCPLRLVWAAADDCISPRYIKMISDKLGKNYNKIASWWTTTQLKNPEYGMGYVRKAMKYSKSNSKYLDIGCGSTGRTISEAIKHDFDITGIDVSSEMIRIAKTKHPNINLVNDDFIQWNTSEKYNLIIAWDSIFHAPKHLQEKITKKMCCLLETGGILLFTAGGIDGECAGNMEGVKFEYGSLSYLDYLNIIDEMSCKTILMESDQHPLNHMVFICQKIKG